MYFKNSIKKMLICSLAVVTLSACTATSHHGDIHDPFEDVNRATLKFNETVDKAVLEPVAKGYRKFTPRAGRTVLSNFLKNLNTPVEMGNQLLQGDIEGFGNAAARGTINTLAGFGGVLDLATEAGFEHEAEDFGQTLAVWGLDSGAYLMLPFMGPSNARDLGGRIVDSYADPLRLYLFNIEEEGIHYARLGASALTQREALIDVIDDLRRNSFDYYAAVRSAYYQQRNALIQEGGAEDLYEQAYYDYE